MNRAYSRSAGAAHALFKHNSRFVFICNLRHAQGANGKVSDSCLHARQLQQRRRCSWLAAACLLSIAAIMWMTMGSASVGREGACTDMTVNTLYLQVGAAA